MTKARSLADIIENGGNVKITGEVVATSFTGSGAGLSGTASGLSIGGNAATATTANNATNLGGQLPEFYRDASNLISGTLASARLSGSYAISITGNAATATTANNATNLGGQLPSFYQNASNLNSGTLAAARLSGTYNISIADGSVSASTLNVLGPSQLNSDVTLGNLSGVSITKFFSDIRLFNQSAGNTGQVIKSRGPGNIPEWADLQQVIAESATSIGSYILAIVVNGPNIAYQAGQTIAGSNLSQVGIYNTLTGGNIISEASGNIGIGTWRAHGYARFQSGSAAPSITLWQRIA